MLYTTKGIVIHQFKYGEKSVIAKIYTEKFGIQSYIINGVRSKKSLNKAAYLQVLSIVEINAYHKENSGLQQLKNIKLVVPSQSIPFTIYKTTIAFFIAEIVYKSIKEEETNAALFDFLYNSIQVLDLSEKNYNNFHIYFLILFAKYLGFPPQINEKNNEGAIYFDLQEGIFSKLKPPHQAYLGYDASQIIFNIIIYQYKFMELTKIDGKMRLTLLQGLLDYYKIHSIDFKELKTLSVLEELFNTNNKS